MKAHDPFGRAQPTQAHRVVMLVEAAQALAAAAEVPEHAGRFLGQSLLAWLADGGDLVRDHLRVSAPRGSHRTTQAVARALVVPAREADEAGQTVLRFCSHGRESNTSEVG